MRCVHTAPTYPEPALNHREHRRLAGVLLRASEGPGSGPWLTASFPELNEGDADAIRRLVLRGRLARGEQLAGARVYESDAGAVWGWLTDASIRTGAGGVGVDSDLDATARGGGSVAIAVDGARLEAATDTSLRAAVVATGSAHGPRAPETVTSVIEAMTAACRPQVARIVEREREREPAPGDLDPVLWLVRVINAHDLRLPRRFWLVGA
jgi:hypothetical protein